MFENNSHNPVLVRLYFQMTTLTTVGYGDIIPTNSHERLLTLAIFFVVIFHCSHYLRVFTLIFKRIYQQEDQQGKEDSLKHFFGLLSKFNHDYPLPSKLQDRIRVFFL